MDVRIRQEQGYHKNSADNSLVYLGLVDTHKPGYMTETSVVGCGRTKPLYIKTAGKLKVTENKQTENEVLLLNHNENIL